MIPLNEYLFLLAERHRMFYPSRYCYFAIRGLNIKEKFKEDENFNEEEL